MLTVRIYDRIVVCFSLLTAYQFNIVIMHMGHGKK